MDSNKSGVTVIVGVNEANNQLILKKQLRIGFENMRVLKDISDLGNYIKKIYVDSYSIPQAIQIDLSLRQILCSCLFKGECPVMSPTTIFSLDLGSLSKYTENKTLLESSNRHFLDQFQEINYLNQANISSSISSSLS
jgi:hypothetical protein